MKIQKRVKVELILGLFKILSLASKNYCQTSGFAWSFAIRGLNKLLCGVCNETHSTHELQYKLELFADDLNRLIIPMFLLRLTGVK